MPNKYPTDFYIKEGLDLDDYTCDTEVITNKKYLKYVSGVKTVEDEYIPPISLDWYPRCNSYYGFTEDVDAINRVDHLLAAKKFLESFTSIKKDERNNFDPYEETDSHLKYLQSKPTTFIILGKPGIGEQQLGKLLADYWKCVYIDPETLVEEEIKSGSRAGQCIEFNLRCGRAISIDVILRLAEKRVKSKSAEHRGFVLCGFPLIRNDMYQDDPVSSESAIFTVQEIFEEILEPIGKTSQIIRNVSKTSQLSLATGEAEYEGDEEPQIEVVPEDDEEPTTEELPAERPSIFSVDIGSAASEIFKSTDISTNYAAQLNFLFSLCNDPLVIIYIMCQNFDVVTKHEHYRYSLEKNEMIDLMKNYGEGVVYTLYTKTPGFDNEDLPDDSYEATDYTSGLSSSDFNYLTYLPCNFSGNVQTQLEQYRFEALPTIEKHVLLHNPQFFIKVDGRLSPSKMFNIIKVKLKMLPLQMVFVPEKLIEPIIPTGAEDEVLEDIDWESKTPEESFDILKYKKVVNPMFKLRWTRWGSICPVAMKEGTYAIGKPNFAVKFLSHIFFLSDEVAFKNFVRNPRPYLLPPFPRSMCKIMIIGPKASGKSAVAKCLGLLLNGKVLEAIVLQSDYVKRIEKEYLEKVRTDAINEAVQILSEKHQWEYEQTEKTRIENQQKWLIDASSAIGELLLLDRVMLTDDTTAISSFPQRRTIMLSEPSSDQLKQYEHDINRLKAIFEGLELPFFGNIELCGLLNDEPAELIEYLPDHLKNPTPLPEPVSIFEDFVTKYAADKVENASVRNSELNFEDIEEMYINPILEVEEKNAEAGDYHGGWIIVGIPPNPDIVEMIVNKAKPDDIFIFKDPDCTFLLERFKVFGRNEYKDYEGFFRKIDKPSIADRCPSATSTYSYKTRLARGILDEVLENKDLQSASEIIEDTEEEPETETKEVGFVDEDYFATHATRLELKRYEKDLHVFEEQCERLCEYLDDAGIPYKEIIVTDKSLEELMREVTVEVDNRYQYPVHAFTPEERVEEVADFGEPEVPGEGLDEDIELKETGISGGFMQNRRLGDTSIYCPVTYHRNGGLWKGKEEYAAVYNGKLYFMSTEEALEKFLKSPREYVFRRPIEKIPPPRICIVGVPGSGKSTLAKALCASLGLYYVSYDDYLKRALDTEEKDTNLDILLQHLDTDESQAIQNYLLSDEELPEELLDKINLKENWEDEPKRSVGFVIDGFPRRLSDLKYLQKYYAVPDVILELSTINIDVNERYVTRLIGEWKEFTEKAQEEQDIANRLLMDEWEETRRIKVEELMEGRRNARFQAKMQEKRELELDMVREEDEEGYQTDRSMISYDSVAEEADLEEVNALLDEELPEPVFEDNWETLEEATQRIAQQTQANFTADITFIRAIKEYCENQLIDWAFIDASTSISKVFDQAMIAIDKYKFRNISVFERCYDINIDVAERLLSEGYAFLSRFGKICPVQVYDRHNVVPMYYPLEQKMELFPIYHRNYIYFLAGKKNREKFVADPLRYILKSDVSFPLIPYRVAVIGPPKSGKTSLAERFRRELGLKCVSIGQAARYVLRILPFSRLAKEMEFVLRNGWELTSEMAMRCVEAMSFDGRAITQGLVFDGFPNSRHDADHLAEMGLIPHLVVHLNANMDDTELFLSTDKGRKGLPVFSLEFIKHRCEEWFRCVDDCSNWLDSEYQVWKMIEVKPCKWGVWKSAFDLAQAAMFEIQYYFRNCHRDMALHLANMQVTPAEFKKRCSSFKHYCPSCLCFDNKLVNGGDPPDRTGLVQFRNNFYWVCNEHIDEFVNDPELYLSPYNEKVLPGDLPLQVVLSEKPKNCYENGICIVCYWESKYDKVMKEGSLEFACSYRDKIYLFDTRECMAKFINEPHKFYSKTVHYKSNRSFSSLQMDDLPILGMLEQYVAGYVVKAVTNTAITRPLLAGLDIQQSAAINIALHLKIHNPNTPKEFIPLYERAYKLLTERRMKFINSLARMKRTINPYLHYEEPLEKLVLPESDKYTSSSEKESTEKDLPSWEESTQSSEYKYESYSSMGSLMKRITQFLEPE